MKLVLYTDDPIEHKGNSTNLQQVYQGCWTLIVQDSSHKMQKRKKRLFESGSPIFHRKKNSKYVIFFTYYGFTRITTGTSLTIYIEGVRKAFIVVTMVK